MTNGLAIIKGQVQCAGEQVSRNEHIYCKENSQQVACSSVDSWLIVNTQTSWLCLATILFSTPRASLPDFH